MNHLPIYSDIENAEKLLRKNSIKTPLLESSLLNEALGGRILIKPECLQRTGSFKFRGAFNKISNIEQNKLKNGVVAYSSGNHAQGVAHAAQLFGISATIIMPNTAPAVKKQKTKEYGATVIEYDIQSESREKLGQAISEETGAILIKPYDDPYVIAGQGTVGIEICRDLNVIAVKPDQLLSPCGGGGLIAGISLATHQHFPDCKIFSCEPEGFDDTLRSLESGVRVSNDPGNSSICDAIITPTPGELTYQINEKHLSRGICVTDEQVLNAMKVAFEHFNIVVEPGGAVALAAVISSNVDVTNKTTIVICSGGNVDSSLFARCLTRDITFKHVT